MGFSGTPKDMGPAYGKRDPYYSHIFRDSYGNSMGPAYHKGVPLLGVPGKSPIGRLSSPRAYNQTHISRRNESRFHVVRVTEVMDW